MYLLSNMGDFLGEEPPNWKFTNVDPENWDQASLFEGHSAGGVVFKFFHSDFSQILGQWI